MLNQRKETKGALLAVREALPLGVVNSKIRLRVETQQAASSPTLKGTPRGQFRQSSISRAGMNVANLRSALDAASSVGLNPIAEGGRFHPPFGAQMVLHAVNVAHGCPRTQTDAKLPRARSKKRNGDCVLMDSRLLHRSTANVSDGQ